MRACVRACRRVRARVVGRRRRQNIERVYIRGTHIVRMHDAKTTLAHVLHSFASSCHGFRELKTTFLEREPRAPSSASRRSRLSTSAKNASEPARDYRVRFDEANIPKQLRVNFACNFLTNFEEQSVIF